MRLIAFQRKQKINVRRLDDDKRLNANPKINDRRKQQRDDWPLVWTRACNEARIFPVAVLSTNTTTLNVIFENVWIVYNEPVLCDQHHYFLANNMKVCA